MRLFRSSGDWRKDAVDALELTNQELSRMHQMLKDWDDDYIHLDMTRNELLERIINYQDTLLEATRRLCGLEY